MNRDNHTCQYCKGKFKDKRITLKGGRSKGNLKHATQMNSIRVQLLKMLPGAEETFGYVTKEHRQLLNLPNEHYMNALAIASQGNE